MVEPAPPWWLFYLFLLCLPGMIFTGLNRHAIGNITYISTVVLFIVAASAYLAASWLAAGIACILLLLATVIGSMQVRRLKR